ncbi:MAG: hypothetical protein ABIS06_14415 [Vicinamibacterales bacterium]
MLWLGFCSHQAALFACRAFHYSRTMPVGKAVRVGVWEDGAFIGCVLFSRGNTPHIGRPFDLPQWEVCKLTRVALAEHRTPTSRILAIAVRMLRRHCPGLRLVVSYADPQQQHVGTIYQRWAGAISARPGASASCVCTVDSAIPVASAVATAIEVSNGCGATSIQPPSASCSRRS